MAIYKKGSKGEGVKEIQRLLCRAGYTIGIDGDFGVKTESLVRQFQKDKGLVPIDGIVGTATAKKLQECVVGTADALNITPQYINIHITPSPKRTVKYLAIHYTAGATSGKGAALNTRSAFLRRAASADFVVDDHDFVQINPDPKNYYCWAVGDKKNPYTGGGRLYGKAKNKNTVSIEICSNLRKGASGTEANHDGWYFTEAALENARRLARYLMKTYNIPKENVVRHYDVSGKLCPGVPGWNDGPLFTTDGKQTKEKSDSSLWRKFWESL